MTFRFVEGSLLFVVGRAIEINAMGWLVTQLSSFVTAQDEQLLKLNSFITKCWSLWPRFAVSCDNAHIDLNIIYLPKSLVEKEIIIVCCCCWASSAKPKAFEPRANRESFFRTT